MRGNSGKVSEHQTKEAQQDIPKHLEDLEDKGMEGYPEVLEVDILQDGLATHEWQEQ